MNRDPRDDYDSPWKLILSRYLREALEHLFPEAAGAIDWTVPVESRDTELQRIRPDGDTGRRYLDKLVAVTRRDGIKALALIHLEVQGQVVPDFAERMFRYYARLTDLHREPVASFAILADDVPDWRPDHHHARLWGCEQSFRFPIAKLLDHASEPGSTLMSRLCHAHWQARRTRGNPEARRQVKFDLITGLHAHFSEQEVRDAYTFIDWVLRLPLDLERRFHDDMRRFEEERAMADYVSFAELVGIEKGLLVGIEQGREEGREEGREFARQLLRRQFIRKFGPLSATLESRFSAASMAQLETWAERLVLAVDAEAVFA